jgi:hypothetical protein
MSKEPKGRPGHGSASGNPFVTRPDVPTIFVTELSEAQFSAGIVVLTFSELRVHHGQPMTVEVARLAMPSATASDLSQRIVALAQGAQLQAQAPVSRVKM